jgi:hypothetical protein
MGAALRRETWPIRLAALGLTALMFLGSLILVALPLAWLWFLSNLSLGYLEIYFLALIGCPTAIVGGVMVLLRLNRAYTNLTERDGRPVLEASITLAVLIAVAALIFWVVFLGAEGDPNRGPWPS